MPTRPPTVQRNARARHLRPLNGRPAHAPARGDTVVRFEAIQRGYGNRALSQILHPPPPVSTPAQTTVQRGPDDDKGKKKKEGTVNVQERIRQRERQIRKARSRTPPKKELRIKKRPPKLPPKGRRKVPTSSRTAKPPAPVTGLTTKPVFRPKLKKRKPLAQQRKAPPRAPNPFKKIRDDLTARIAFGEQAPPDKVWTVKKLKGQKGGAEDSQLYKDIVKTLGEYHQITVSDKDSADAKQSKAITAQVWIRKWLDSKATKFQVVFSQDKRDRRTALKALSEQLSEEGTWFTQVYEMYALRERCDEFIKVSRLPQRTMEEIKKKRNKFDTWLYEMPHNPRDLSMALRSKVVGWTEWAGKKLKAEKERQDKRAEAREKRFLEWLGKQKGRKGLLSTGVSQAGLAELGHNLEGVDPKHREGRDLQGLLQKWYRADTKLWFYRWVDEWEKTNKQVSRIRYLVKPQDRAKYELAFEGLQPYYAKRPPRGTDQKRKRMAKGIFVMTPDHKFYARRETRERQKTFHHSSFLAGLPVGAAGVMWTAEGKLYLNLESGHYQPTMRHMANAVRGLLTNGFSQPDLRNVMVRILDKKDPISAMMLASDFYGSLHQIKLGRPPLGKFFSWMQANALKSDDPTIQDAAKVLP